MAQILVRNLDESTISRLKARAQSHGRSLQAEAKTILEQAAPDWESAWKRIDEIRKRLGARRFGDSAKIIRRDRDRRR